MGRQAGTTAPAVSLATIARQWTRIGVIGFGGPPAHIALLRKLCVDERGWIDPEDFEDAIAAVNLLPGPASTQLAIFCAWRLRRAAGALVGGACFIVPGLIVILALAAALLKGHPPRLVEGAASGAAAAVPAVAVAAALGLATASLRRARERQGPVRWGAELAAGGASGALIGPWLVLVLLGCGLIEMAAGPLLGKRREVPAAFGLVAKVGAVAAAAGLGSLCWLAFKVGALSYGGGFVIVPLMQQEAVHSYHFLTNGQFLDAVALGQVTPGPVVLTVAAVGYAADRLRGGLLAALVAFAPSFAFVLTLGPHLGRVKQSAPLQRFLDGAGPAAIGAIAGAAIPLGLALAHLWQVGVLAVALVWLVAARRGVVGGILGAAGLGVLAALAGAAVPR